MVCKGHWKGIILCLCSLGILVCNNADAQIVSYQHIYEATYPGQDFFVVGERVYLILWDWGPHSGFASSVIASAPVGRSEWTTVSIPGQAFFLGGTVRNEILSIVQKGDQWELSFYALNGQLLRVIDHTYTQQPREYQRTIPIPIPFPDGSILLYTQYEYEAHPDPVAGFFRHLVSSAQRVTLKQTGYIELIPAFVAPHASSFSYLTVSDSSLDEITVFGIPPEFTIDAMFCSRTISSIPPYQILEYRLTDRNINFYYKPPHVMTLSYGGISLSIGEYTDNIIAPFPPIPKEVEENIIEGSFLDHPCSDIVIDTSLDSLVYVFLGPGIPGMSRMLYLLLYDRTTSEWKTNWIPIDSFRADSNLASIRIGLWQNTLYLALGEYIEKVTLIQCDVNALKEGGLLTFSE